METNQFIKATVGVVVVFLVIVAVAILVISGINVGTTTTLDVEGQRYSLIEDPITISEVSSDSSSITIDIAGVEYTYTEGQLMSEIIGYGFDIAIIEPESAVSEFSLMLHYITPTGSESFYFSNLTIEADHFVRNNMSYDLFGPAYIKDDSGGYALITEGSVDVPAHSTFIGMTANSYDSISGLFENGIMTKYGTDEQDEIPSNYDKEPFEISNGMIHITMPVIYWPPDIGSFDMLIIPLEYTVVSDSDAAIISILNIIPLLMIVGLIIAAVASFITLKSRGGGA